MNVNNHKLPVLDYNHPHQKSKLVTCKNWTVRIIADHFDFSKHES